MRAIVASCWTLGLLGVTSLGGCTGPSPVVGRDTAGGAGKSAGSAESTGGAGADGGTGSGTGGAASIEGTTGGTGLTECASDSIVATEASNYRFSSIIDLTATTIRPNEPNIDVDWVGLTTDFLGHSMSPTEDVDSVLFVVLGLTLEEFEQHLNDDDGTLRNYNQGALQLLTNQALTLGSLPDFTVPDTANTYRNNADVKEAVDAFLDPMISDPENHLLAVMPSTGTVPGAGARMIQTFTLDAASTETTVVVGPNSRLPHGANGHTGGTVGPSMSLSFDVELEALTPTLVPLGKSDLVLDWSQMATNGLGREWLRQSIYRVSVGRYLEELPVLESQFLELESRADALYDKIVLADAPLSLAELEDGEGNAFTGIDDTGVWLLALFCDPRYCGNPAPWYLTVLEPCE